MPFLPHKLILRDYILYVINEDLTYNDVTSDLILDDKDHMEVIINYRSTGVVCGLPYAQEVYNIIDPTVTWEVLVEEGTVVNPNTDVVKLSGPAKSILTGERTALNILQRASGIATTTAEYVKKLEGTSTRVTDTRKTTPGARLLEKYAVKIGGAYPHRYNLSDCVLIKDNHIQIAGSITEAINRVKKHISHTTKIEVETENKQHVLEALEVGADIIMLDNMTVEETKEMVQLINGRAITESSGNINLQTIRAYAVAGVDYVSTSAINTKAPVLDIGMDVK